MPNIINCFDKIWFSIYINVHFFLEKLSVVLIIYSGTWPSSLVAQYAVHFGSVMNKKQSKIIIILGNARITLKRILQNESASFHEQLEFFDMIKNSSILFELFFSQICYAFKIIAHFLLEKQVNSMNWLSKKRRVSHEFSQILIFTCDYDQNTWSVCLE